MAVNPFFSAVKLLIFLLGSKKRRLFIEACKNPVNTQDELKRRILSKSKITYPEKATTYFDYMETKALTQEKVLYFETTSGSSGAKKEIPYTKSLLKSFQNMFLLWVHDLVFFSETKFKTGKFFMSVSPQIGEASNDDRKYLSLPFRLLLSPFLVSNPNNHKSQTSDEFLFKIAKDLLSNRNLEIISIWSPTYLLGLLEFIENNQEDLNVKIESWEKIWPNLKLISCWTHAQAEHSGQILQKKFPHVKIQGKGLLLTEAPITIPWSEAKGNIPLITETIIEFFEENQIRKMDELEIGKHYVVLSGQHNGYLRYNTEDIVKVTGFYYKVPILEFVGRVGQQIDLAGEKFSETLLRSITKDHEACFFVIPDLSRDLPRYIILTEMHDIIDWDKKLNSIHHYKLARNLNQLKAPVVIKTRSPYSLYVSYCQSKGMNLGDIKEKILFSNSTDAKKFLAWIQQELRSLPLD
jgi:hypothetical protein